MTNQEQLIYSFKVEEWEELHDKMIKHWYDADDKLYLKIEEFGYAYVHEDMKDFLVAFQKGVERGYITADNIDEEIERHKRVFKRFKAFCTAIEKINIPEVDFEF